MTKFTCDICNAPMKLKDKLSNHKTSTKNYRRRRFKCTICDYEKLIFADGWRDSTLEEFESKRIIDKKFRQEQINRESK